MARYECTVCGYIHDESSGGSFGELGGDWKCPVCGAEKSQFERVAESEDAESAGGVASSSARGTGPSPMVLGHRVFGYVFLAIYVILMVQMVPRLWTYQIEFPARTVVHLSLGIAVGVMLLLKISIVRFFRRLDQALVPMLGSWILISSVVLVSIAIPPAFQEAAATANLFTQENRERVKELLAQADLDEAQCARYSSVAALRGGQRVLRGQCIACHDLRTVLARPRTPSSWRQTVARMADRAQLMNPLSEESQWKVTAYLVALSPQLRLSRQQMREAEDRQDQSRRAAEAATGGATAEYDPASAAALFEATCSQCHRASLVDSYGISSEADAQDLVARMVEEGLEADEAELATIVRYLTETHTQSPE